MKNMQIVSTPKISDAEWEIMRVIWTNEPVTSRTITEVLSEKMAWKAATIKTLIGRLVEKGFVSTEANGNRFLYSALISEEESMRERTGSVLQHVCSTKVGATLAELISQSVLSKEDIKLLERAVSEKAMDAVETVQCHCLHGQCDCHANHEEE